MAITALGLLLGAVIAATVLVPFIYVAITWDHDVARAFGALPAPSDVGTKEFAWRCWLSPLTRIGWRTAIVRSACPRLTLQCPFALLSTDFAQLATSLGFATLALEKLPFVVPQVATSSLLLQLFGNSNFPASVRDVRLKALTITQLRPLDMRFRDQHDDAATAPQDIKCVMVLTEKRFLDNEIEFTVQTDLFDDAGTLWQSVAWYALPFTQQMLLVPLMQTGFRIDAALLEQSIDKPIRKTIACTARNVAEFACVATPSVNGANAQDKTPVLWVLGQVAAILQREHRVPALPLMCNVRFDDDAASVALGAALTVETSVKGAATAADAADDDTDAVPQSVQFAVTSGQIDVMRGLLRTVGWTFNTADDGAN